MVACVSFRLFATKGNILSLGGADFGLISQRPVYGAGAETSFGRQLLNDGFGILAFAGTAFACLYAFYGGS